MQVRKDQSAIVIVIGTSNGCMLGRTRQVMAACYRIDRLHVMVSKFGNINKGSGC